MFCVCVCVCLCVFACAGTCSCRVGVGTPQLVSTTLGHFDKQELHKEPAWTHDVIPCFNVSRESFDNASGLPVPRQCRSSTHARTHKHIRTRARADEVRWVTNAGHIPSQQLNGVHDDHATPRTDSSSCRNRSMDIGPSATTGANPSVSHSYLA